MKLGSDPDMLVHVLEEAIASADPNTRANALYAYGVVVREARRKRLDLAALSPETLVRAALVGADSGRALDSREVDALVAVVDKLEETERREVIASLDSQVNGDSPRGKRAACLLATLTAVLRFAPKGALQSWWKAWRLTHYARPISIVGTLQIAIPPILGILLLFYLPINIGLNSAEAGLNDLPWAMPNQLVVCSAMVVAAAWVALPAALLRGSAEHAIEFAVCALALVAVYTTLTLPFAWLKDALAASGDANFLSWSWLGQAAVVAISVIVARSTVLGLVSRRYAGGWMTLWPIAGSAALLTLLGIGAAAYYLLMPPPAACPEWLTTAGARAWFWVGPAVIATALGFAYGEDAGARLIFGRSGTSESTGLTRWLLRVAVLVLIALPFGAAFLVRHELQEQRATAQEDTPTKFAWIQGRTSVSGTDLGEDQQLASPAWAPVELGRFFNIEADHDFSLEIKAKDNENQGRREPDYDIILLRQDRSKVQYDAEKSSETRIPKGVYKVCIAHKDRAGIDCGGNGTVWISSESLGDYLFDSLMPLKHQHHRIIRGSLAITVRFLRRAQGDHPVAIKWAAARETDIRAIRTFADELVADSSIDDRLETRASDVNSGPAPYGSGRLFYFKVETRSLADWLADKIRAKFNVKLQSTPLLGTYADEWIDRLFVSMPPLSECVGSNYSVKWFVLDDETKNRLYDVIHAKSALCTQEVQVVPKEVMGERAGQVLYFTGGGVDEAKRLADTAKSKLGVELSVSSKFHQYPSKYDDIIEIWIPKTSAADDAGVQSTR